ncbi:dihydroxyacetone kinase subunit DhaL [Streptomyces sp. NPDC127033]|uniref:dihydroxyacetone kinase subunit DhaL n=1 Tax=Streptomyces sp. NPDC127033 TaxID=3347110 RepID=UPI00365D261E
MDSTLVGAWLGEFARTVEEGEARLTSLDSAIGDGDHGVNMRRGVLHVRRLLLAGEPPDTVGELLTGTGVLLRTHVGGASGALYGSTFQAMGAALPVRHAGAARFGDALEAGLAAVVRLGAAVPGDKTMVDAFEPAVSAFRDVCARGADLGTAVTAAAAAADVGARSTIPMQARKGRASYLGHRSIGHLDPGAASTGMLFRSLAEVVAARRPRPAGARGRKGRRPCVESECSAATT